MPKSPKEQHLAKAASSVTSQPPDAPATANTLEAVHAGRALQISSQGVYLDAPVASALPTSQNLVGLGEFTAKAYGSDPQFPAVLLLLPEDVEVQEVEALAVSLWETAGWVGPGLLRLNVGEMDGTTLQARLQGPWRVSAHTARQYGFASWVAQVFALDAPIQRTATPVAPQFQGISPITDAFLHGEPWGVERQAINGLWAMARRLGGGLLIHDGPRPQTKAQLLQPDPDSAVGLTVYSPLWLNAEQMQALLQPLVPRIYCPAEEDAPNEQPNWVNTTPVVDNTLLTQTQTWLREIFSEQQLQQINAEAEAFAQATAWAKAQGIPPSGYYRVLLEKSRGQVVQVEVEPNPWCPPVLRWEEWTRKNCVAYQISWDMVTDQRKTLSRSQRVARLRVTEQIEVIAKVIVETLGGSVVDPDGFLVNL